MSFDKPLPIENSAKRRELWLDIAKGLAILFVIFGHTYKPDSILCVAVASFSLPLFFIVAGHLFNFPKYKGNFRGFFLHAIKRLILPYFFTMFVYILYWIIIQRPDFSLILQIFNKMLRGWLYSCGNIIKPSMNIIPIGVLWFLTALFISIILFFVMLKIFDKLKISLLTKFLIVFCIAYIGSYIGKFIFLPWSIDIALVTVFFMFFGYAVKEKYINIDCNLTVFLWLLIFWYFDIASGSLSLNDRTYNNLLLSLFGACTISFVILQLSKLIEKKCPNFIKKFLSYCGKYSLIILIFHVSDVGYFHFNNYIPHYKEVIMSNYYYLYFLRLLFSILCIEIIKLLPVFSEIYIGKQPFYYKFFKNYKNEELNGTK